MSVYTGSCLCGSVTYETTGEPRRVFECYCNWCQKITGGGAVRQTSPSISIQLIAISTRSLKSATR